jgi:nucleoporin POM34
MSFQAKSTPTKPTVASPATDSPGTWRHPRLDEITRRRNATTFTEKNVRQIAYNLVAFIGLWFVELAGRRYLGSQVTLPTYRLYISWAWLLVKLLPLTQVGVACLPLVRKEDDLSDVPLTSAQRKLLGLPPTTSAPTPDAKFSTPPRYSRTPSIAGSVGSRGSYTGSPLSGRGSPLLGASTGPLGTSSPPSSPLLHKGSSGLGSRRRSSFSSSTLFGASTSSSVFGESGSLSPSGGKRTSVGLNNKWLYEKGRRSSGSAWLQ